MCLMNSTPNMAISEKKNTPIRNIPRSQQNFPLWNHTFSNHSHLNNQKNWFSDRSPTPDFLQSAWSFLMTRFVFVWESSATVFRSVFSVGSRSHRHGLLEEVGAPPKMSANYGWWPLWSRAFIKTHWFTLLRRQHLKETLIFLGKGVLLIHVFYKKNTTWAVAQFEGLGLGFFCVKQTIR